MDFSQINIGLGFLTTSQVRILQTFLFSFPDLSSERGQVTEGDILIRWNGVVEGGRMPANFTAWKELYLSFFLAY